MEKIIDNYSYSMNDKLGQGAYGQVYKGKIISTSELVAIKVLNKHLI